MSNTQLLAAIIMFFGLLLLNDRRRFKKMRSKHNVLKLHSECRDLIIKIGQAQNSEDLDVIELQTCILLADESDNEVWKNAVFVLEHFKMRRHELYGNINEANECADRISEMMMQNPQVYGRIA